MPKDNSGQDPERQLMIKTKACQRLHKEVEYYKKEVQENEAKLAIMREEQRDAYDIKKFEEVLGESYMMVPDSENRLRKGLEDLAHFLESDSFQQQKDKSEWESAARELLKTHSVATAEISDNEIVKETDVQSIKDDEVF